MSKLREVPKILDIPKIFYPMLEGLNEHRYTLLEGGRNSLKSHTVARLILYLCEQRKYRVVCGREIQKSIEDSVHALFSDLISEFNLFFDVGKATIKHKETGSTIRFIGLREQGVANVKSLEGCDIFWGEEAQMFSKATVDILLPTIRKPDSKLFFTMNRFIRKDPIFVNLANRKDCLHIHANFDDIEPRFIAANVLVEAAQCKARSEKDHRHIWKGQPLETTEEYLFNFDKLDKCKKVEPFGDLIKKQRVVGIDLAGGGGDLCVASLIERTSNVHWKLINQIAWDKPDTDETVGKIIKLYSEWLPDVVVCDAGGLGYGPFCTLSKTITNIVGFDGSKNDKCTNPTAHNNRYQAYWDLKQWIDQEWLRIDSDYTIVELETIKKKYLASGKMVLQSKIEMRRDQIDSPDRADSVSYAVFGAVHFLGKHDFETEIPYGMRLTRVNNRKRR